MEFEEVYNKLFQHLNELNNKQTAEITKQISEVKEIVQREIQKTKDIEKKYNDLKIKYEKLEKSSRKNNLIIFGVNIPEAETLLEYTLHILNERLGLVLSENDVNDIYTIGKKTDNKPIILKLVSYLKKATILKNVKKLKGSHIFISEELNLEERKERKILVQHLKQAKERNLNAFIKGNKLVLNDKLYTAKQLVEEEEEVTENEIERDFEEEIIETHEGQGKINKRGILNNTESTSTNKKTRENQGDEENLLDTEQDHIKVIKKYKGITNKITTRSNQKK